MGHGSSPCTLRLCTEAEISDKPQISAPHDPFFGCTQHRLRVGGHPGAGRLQCRITDHSCTFSNAKDNLKN
jgi:hypothetical protein